MRYFISKDAGAVIREKQQFAGDETQADALIAAFLASHVGWTAEELNEAAFATAVVVKDHAPSRADAISALLSDTSANAKFIRAVLLVMLDEVNTIRALLPGPPAARTVNQLKTAIQNKINAGTAD